MLRETLVHRDASGKETILDDRLRGEGNDPVKTVVLYGGGPLNLGGKRKGLGPGESVRLESKPWNG